MSFRAAQQGTVAEAEEYEEVEYEDDEEYDEEDDEEVDEDEEEEDFDGQIEEGESHAPVDLVSLRRGHICLGRTKGAPPLYCCIAPALVLQWMKRARMSPCNILPQPELKLCAQVSAG